MEDLSKFAHRPLSFMARYVRRRPVEHTIILTTVVAAVGCSIGTQYGVKFLVDTLSQAQADHRAAWVAFALLFSLIAADNLLWRVASFVASGTFVRVTGLLRHDLFRHLTGHSPAYFSRRPAGALTSRITATSNALFTVENMLVWNVIPPCVATIGTVFLVATVSVEMAAVLLVVGLLVMVGMYHIARAGRRLHHEFAHKAAAVDGEMTDILGNMPLVVSFDGLRREHRRFDAALGREMMARRGSLYYLERLRLMHALTTVALTFVLLAWAIMLWDQGKATVGDVVLVSTLGLSVLHATRDLAIALVDVIQHIARLSEALTTLLVPHELQDHPQARPLKTARTSVAFSKVHFDYPDGRTVFDGFDLRIRAGERIGLIGTSGSGKSTLIALLQRFYDVQGGRIMIDGEDISRVTQHSLRKLIAVVPQDIALFNRTLRENIRYGNPFAARRASKGGGAGRALRRLHRRTAERLGYSRGRSRRQPVGRPASAHRHRARLPQECPRPGAGRGNLRAQFRLGGSDPRGHGPADARAHGDSRSASAVDPAQLRSHRRTRSGTHSRGRPA